MIICYNGADYDILRSIARRKGFHILNNHLVLDNDDYFGTNVTSCRGSSGNVN